MRSNWVEWVALVASVAAIAAVVGFLVVDGLTNRGTTAIPTIRIDRAAAYETDIGWVLPATLRNEGDAPAERLVLEASADVAGELEMSTFDVDFLPSGTEVEVFIGFSAEPEGEVDVRIVGFLAP